MRRKPLLLFVPLIAVIGIGGLPCHWVAGAQPAAAQSAPAGEEVGPDGVREVRLEIKEWSLSPAHIHVDLGVPVRLLATNHGVLAHALAVEGDSLYAETETIGSQETRALELTFDQPGSYDLYCPVAAGQHRLLGQEGRILAGADGDEDAPDPAALIDAAAG